MTCIVWLWCDILRSIICWFLHVDRSWGLVSFALLGHKVQLGLGWMKGQIWFPMYWVHWNLRVCVNWASVIPVTFEKWLESLWFICLFNSHLSKYGNLFVVCWNFVSSVLYLWVYEGCGWLHHVWLPTTFLPIRDGVSNVCVDCGGSFVFVHSLASKHVWYFVSGDTSVSSYFVFVDLVGGPIYLVYKRC